MIFNSLRINNYRAYYVECNFDFPIDGERNISILYADNDVGKSCFFSAILFCLYGPKDSDDLKDLINVNAQSEKCYHAAVSLFVENGSDKIEISRIIDLRGKLEATPSSKDFKCTLELIKNDVPLSSEEDEKADFINSECFQKNATLMLAASIFAKMQQDTSSEPTEYHITEPVKEYLVRLMEQPICVCGEPMTDSHKEKIQAFIQDHLVTDDAILVEKERRALFNACAQYQPHGFKTRAAYFSLSEEIWKKEKERSAKKEEFEHLRKDIGSFNEEAGERIIQDIANVEVKKQEAETRRTKTQVLLEQDQEKLARLEEKLAELSQLDKEGALCQKKLENTIALEKIFSVYRNRLLEEKRAFVEKYATEVFLQITNAPQKYKGIKIASDYSLLLELTNGETYQIEPGRTLNPSTGQSKVISLSYIAGLNRSSDFAAPVIIDNPLGLFSDEHRAAITRFLPHMGKQVIFMVSTGDLTEKYQNELKPYVKTVYKLENHSDQTWPKTVIASKEVY